MSPPSRCLAFCGLIPSIVVSLALNVPQSQGSSLALTSPSSLLPSLNSSAATEKLLNQSTAAILKESKVDCDERRFGHPPGDSCRNAIAQLPQDPATVIRDPTLSYGPRGQGAYDVGLPKRYISCEHVWILESGLVCLTGCG